MRHEGWTGVGCTQRLNVLKQQGLKVTKVAVVQDISSGDDDGERDESEAVGEESVEVNEDAATTDEDASGLVNMGSGLSKEEFDNWSTVSQGELRKSWNLSENADDSG